MRDVALVPKGDVFESGLGIRTDNPRQAADLLACHWVALVRHCRRAFLIFAEIFFYFADFGALQVANLGRKFVESACDDGERCQIIRMTISLNHL